MMKSTSYIALAFSLLLVGAHRASACGPFFPCIPTPCFYAASTATETDPLAGDNLRDWQRLTSARIPLGDIEEAVNHWDDYGWPDDGERMRNRFQAYLIHTNDGEIMCYLSLATELAKLRAEHDSPWYYPASRDEGKSDYDAIVSRIRHYSGKRLASRYALQLVRALFASRRWGECVREYEKRLATLPETDVMRRMAQGYVAGCLLRLGQVERANGMFAAAGDFRSLRTDNPARYMASRNPDAKSFRAYLADPLNHDDTLAVRRLLPVVRQITEGGKTRYLGDFLLWAACAEGNFNGNFRQAGRFIGKALKSQFSSPDLSRRARLYSMVCDAESGNRSSLLASLRWLEDKTNPSNADCEEYERYLKNIVCVHWVPRLMREGDCTLAVLLAGYADNVLGRWRKSSIEPWDSSYGEFWRPAPTVSASIGEMRSNPKYFNTLDYSSMSFELMSSMPVERLASVKARIGHGDALQAYLEKYARCDADYLNELLGTLCLRNEKYDVAVSYLSKVSVQYQRNMNIYPFLSRDPFVVYPQNPDIYEYNDGCRSDWLGKHTPLGEPAVTPQPCDNAKLRFARRMLQLERAMRTAKSRQQRALARLDYETGVRNSKERCWALTQYYRGCVDMFMPSMDCGGWPDYEPLASWITFYTDEQQLGTERRFQKAVKEALATSRDKETLAQIHLRLRNYRTIAKRYPHTSAARYLKAHCDHWKNWL